MSLILTEIKNKIGFITLNSERTLNSLTLEMILELKTVLTNWEKSEEVVCIFLQGAGEKALCAGGDVRKMYDAIIQQRTIDETQVPQECYDFFSNEYKVNYAIHTYPKPIIVWGHGIVMGGGIGLMVGASHRIVTERSKLAMPEITIGLFPDVGGTWFLNKMPSVFGMYLGLTGARLDGADCVYLGLADYYVSSSQKAEIIDNLLNTDWNGDADQIVSDIIESTAKNNEIPDSKAALHKEFIEQFENVQSVDEFKKILIHHTNQDEWIQTGINSFLKGSPSSAHIIFRQLEQGKNLNLKEVFESELNLAGQCCLHPDFAEGVRALLVDKDQSPKWQPATLEDITEEWVDSYFVKINHQSN